VVRARCEYFFSQCIFMQTVVQGSPNGPFNCYKRADMRSVLFIGSWNHKYKIYMVSKFLSLQVAMAFGISLHTLKGGIPCSSPT